jgi:membrane-associated protease RseP (regulator of RpoE activity)
VAEINGWLILVALIAAYGIAIYLLHARRRLGPDRSLSLYGPALMIKTRRGRGFLERVGRFERLWSVVGDFGIVLAGLAMVLIVGLLSVEAVAISSVPASAAPSPQTALGLPGINPIIPIGYGIVALVIGVVLHELFHGVMARSQKIGVKSLGVLWLVVPIGAFVEQDDVEMAKAPRRARARVVAAGVLANFALCVVFFLASSAILASSVAPNADGAGVAGVLSGYPAANASIQAGDILVSVNGNQTTDNSQLYDALHATHAGQNVTIQYFSHDHGALLTKQVTLAPLSMFTGVANDSTKGFLGVSVTILTPKQLDGIIATPWTAPGPPGAGIAAWIILPLWELQPVQGSATMFYHSTGVLSGVDVGGLWIGVNLFYWLAWMNLLLGLSNALPIFPFDGGLLFREFSASIIGRFRRGWETARRDRAATQAATVASLLVVFLIVWLFVGPRL